MEIFSWHLDFEVQVKSCGQMVNKFDCLNGFLFLFGCCFTILFTVASLHYYNLLKKVYDFWQANKLGS
jgi:hypothetical protein